HVVIVFSAIMNCRGIVRTAIRNITDLKEVCLQKKAEPYLAIPICMEDTMAGRPSMCACLMRISDPGKCRTTLPMSRYYSLPIFSLRDIQVLIGEISVAVKRC